MNPYIQVKNLSKIYGSNISQLYALKNIEFQVTKGEFFVIMGPSGSGKSTLLNLMGGLDETSEGEIRINGEIIPSVEPALTCFRRNKIGFVFQSFNLITSLNAWDNIALPLILADIPRPEISSKVQNIMDVLGISERKEHLPHQMSGGQQQRVALARALINSPDVLLADEPTGNLDSRTSSEILTYLKRLQLQMGQTIVMVTHDPYVASLADRIIFLRDGKISNEMDLNIHVENKVQQIANQIFSLQKDSVSA